MPLQHVSKDVQRTVSHVQILLSAPSVFQGTRLTTNPIFLSRVRLVSPIAGLVLRVSHQFVSVVAVVSSLMEEFARHATG